MRIGVIAIQGDVSEHKGAFRRVLDEYRISGDVIPIRRPGLISGCDLVSIPGGESTTIGRLLRQEGIGEEIKSHAKAGKPIFATCAGLILLSKNVGDDRVYSLGLMDTWVERNAFGRQSDSFQVPLEVKGVDGPFEAVFIRAPAITKVDDTVEVLARYDKYIVAARQGRLYAFAFHPELTQDNRIHRMILSEELQHP
jgi:5'-phosphate synthase pdxT subunit